MSLHRRNLLATTALAATVVSFVPAMAVASGAGLSSPVASSSQNTQQQFQAAPKLPTASTDYQTLEQRTTTVTDDGVTTRTMQVRQTDVGAAKTFSGAPENQSVPAPREQGSVLPNALSSIWNTLFPNVTDGSPVHDHQTVKRADDSFTATDQDIYGNLPDRVFTDSAKKDALKTKTALEGERDDLQKQKNQRDKKRTLLDKLNSLGPSEKDHITSLLGSNFTTELGTASGSYDFDSMSNQDKATIAFEAWKKVNGDWTVAKSLIETEQNENMYKNAIKDAATGDLVASKRLLGTDTQSYTTTVVAESTPLSGKSWDTLDKVTGLLNSGKELHANYASSPNQSLSENSDTLRTIAQAIQTANIGDNQWVAFRKMAGSTGSGQGLSDLVSLLDTGGLDARIAEYAGRDEAHATNYRTLVNDLNDISGVSLKSVTSDGWATELNRVKGELITVIKKGKSDWVEGDNSTGLMGEALEAHAAYEKVKDGGVARAWTLSSSIDADDYFSDGVTANDVTAFRTLRTAHTENSFGDFISDADSLKLTVTSASSEQNITITTSSTIADIKAHIKTIEDLEEITTGTSGAIHSNKSALGTLKAKLQNYVDAVQAIETHLQSASLNTDDSSLTIQQINVQLSDLQNYVATNNTADEQGAFAILEKLGITTQQALDIFINNLNLGTLFSENTDSSLSDDDARVGARLIRAATHVVSGTLTTDLEYLDELINVINSYDAKSTLVENRNALLDQLARARETLLKDLGVDETKLDQALNGKTSLKDKAAVYLALLQEARSRVAKEMAANSKRFARAGSGDNKIDDVLIFVSDTDAQGTTANTSKQITLEEDENSGKQVTQTFESLESDTGIHLVGDNLKVETFGAKAPQITVATDNVVDFNITRATAENTGGEDATVGSAEAKLKSLSITTAAPNEKIGSKKDGGDITADDKTARTIQFKAVYADTLNLNAATGDDNSAIFDIKNVNVGTATVGDRTTLQTAQLNKTMLAGTGTVKYSGTTGEDLTDKIGVENFHLMAGSHIGLGGDASAKFIAGETGDGQAAARIEVGEKLNFTQGLHVNNTLEMHIPNASVDTDGTLFKAASLTGGKGASVQLHLDSTLKYDETYVPISKASEQPKVKVEVADSNFHTYETTWVDGSSSQAKGYKNKRTRVDLSKSFNVSPAYNDTFDALFALDDAKVKEHLSRIAASGTREDVVAVLEQSTSTAATASTQAGIAAGRASNGAVSTRLASLRTGGVQFADLEGNSGVSSGDEIRRNGMWLKGSGSLAEQGRRSGLAGYSSHTRGMTLGMDSLAADNLRVGFALSTAQSKVKSKGADDTRTDVMSYQFATYGSYEPGTYFLEGQVAYALNNTDTKRTVVGGDTATGDFKAHQYTASLGAGVPFGFADGITLTPKAGLFYSRTQSNEYTETGAGPQNLTVKPEATQLLEANLGATLAYEHVNLDGSMFRPELRAAALYEFFGEKATATSKYSGVGATVTPGMEPAQFGGTAGLGIAYTTADGQWEVRADYDAEIRQDYISHNGMLTGRLNF